MNCDLGHMKKGGEIHNEINTYIKNIIKPNMKLFDLANIIEYRIKDLTNYDSKNPIQSGIAFPTGLSVNNCVAHWTPNLGCNKLLLENDVIKIDYGIHFEGSIIDSAFTYCFNDKYETLLEASRTSTELAIKMARPDQLLNEIGKEIEENMCSYEIELNNKIYKIKPVRSLCGHKINKYHIHANKVIPNIYMKDYNERMKSDEFYAVETFASTGTGDTYEDIENCSHFMVNYNKEIKKTDIPNNSNQMYKLILKYYNTLAFTDRWLMGKNLIKNNKKELLETKNINKYLNNLNKSLIINKYPPIYDLDKKSYSSQFEETIYIDETKTIILSK
jgi:methionyl aminopeptidase